MSGYWMQTFTGKALSPLEPRVEDLDIVDIAHALSLQCRYTGHVQRFYSVAEHSIRVSREVESIAWKCNWARNTRLVAARWALVHDATEAYMSDLSRPLKTHPSMAPYRVAEAVLAGTIEAWLGLEGLRPNIVGLVDADIIGLEARQLMHPLRPEWKAPPMWPGHHYLGWTPEVAERNFLQRFRRLWGSVSSYTDAKGYS